MNRSNNNESKNGYNNIGLKSSLDYVFQIPQPYVNTANITSSNYMNKTSCNQPVIKQKPYTTIRFFPSK